MSTDELLQALMDIDPEFREELIEALTDDPEELREALERVREQPTPETTGEGDDEWRIISDQNEGELPQEPPEWEPEADLTRAEEALYSVVKSSETPRTAGEIRQLAKREHEDQVDRYHSLDNRGWISTKLNKLAKAGLVGKYREGREVKYTPDVVEAVRNWALKNDVFVEDLSPADHADRVVADTNMNRDAVLYSIQVLVS